MDKFQFQLMIQNLDNGKNVNNLSLETINSYIIAINTSSLSTLNKEKYIKQLHNIFISVPRNSTDISLISDIAYGLHMYNTVPYE